MNKVMRWTGYGLAGLLGIVVVAGLTIWALSARALAQRVEPKPERLVMAGANIANGQHLLQTAAASIATARASRAASSSTRADWRRCTRPI